MPSKNTIYPRPRHGEISVWFNEHTSAIVDEWEGSVQQKTLLSICSFLTNRGWKVGPNEYYTKNHNCLSRYHKIAYKGDMVMLLGVSGIHFEIKIGNVINLWDSKQSIWDGHIRKEMYHSLNYLQQKRIQVEYNKLSLFLNKKLGYYVEPDTGIMSPEEYIIHDSNKSCHHGVVTKLEDLNNSVKEGSYNYNQNSNDRNKKKIKCGDKKYFYDWATKRLMCGTVWYCLNMNWHVISNNRRWIVQSYDLFDYDQSLPKRKPAKKEHYVSLLEAFGKQRMYSRCQGILNYCQKLGIQP